MIKDGQSPSRTTRILYEQFILSANHHHRRTQMTEHANNDQIKHHADCKMIRVIEPFPGKKTRTETIVKNVMKAKAGLNI